VSLARAMGADVVIAVDLASNLLGRRFRAASHVEPPVAAAQKWMHELRETIGGLGPDEAPDDPAMPSMMDVLATCMDIVQVRIARSRLAGEPPDITIAPRLSHLRLFDFHCAKQAIEEGYLAVERVAGDLAALEERAA